VGWSMQGFTSLTIPSGATTGKRIVIADPVTGNALEVYNAANQLVAWIDGFGIYHEFSSSPTSQEVQYKNDGMHLTGDTLGDTGTVVYVPATSVSGQPQLQAVVTNGNGSSVYTLQIVVQGEDGTGTATLIGDERGVPGSVLQSDQVSTNNLTHRANYSVTTNASGIGTFAHNAGFTPKGAVATATAAVAAGATQFSFQPASWTSTQGTVAVKTPAGAVYVGTATFDAELWG